MKSFYCAIKGFIAAVGSERNMRFHLCAAFYVVCAGLMCRVTAGEWAVLALCIALVMGMELVNTALETLCDALHPERDAKIGRVKDVSAGAVLLCAVGAAVAGGLIFFRQDKIQTALDSFRQWPVLIGLAIASLPLAVFFIRGRKKR